MRIGRERRKVIEGIYFITTITNYALGSDVHMTWIS
jgi:hypothetical protein